jgi:hypothetical protein
MSTCSALGIDCSKTCCLETKCAKKLNDEDCLGYETRSYVELYIGFGTIIGLFVGIPWIIKIINCLMLHKFCMRFDEMSQVYWGGYSVCDCFSKLCFCCCYKTQAYEYEQPSKEADEDEKAKIEKQKSEEAFRNVQIDDPDSKISAKNRLIKRNKCVSCLCFVFGCASKTAVQAEPRPPVEKHVYLEDEEGGES